MFLRELPGGFAELHLISYGIYYRVVLPLIVGITTTEVTVELDTSGKRVRVSISYELPLIIRIRIPQASATTRDKERVDIARAVRL